MEDPGNSPLPFGMDHLSLRLDSQEPYVSLHFIIIFVRDQERSLRFYLDQLGFRLIVDARVAGIRWPATATRSTASAPSARRCPTSARSPIESSTRPH